MPTLEVQPEFLSDQDSKVIASRQMLSFLAVPETNGDEQVIPTGPTTAPSKFLFSLGALPEDAIEGPTLFKWTSRDIYDVDGRLLLRDQTINLGNGNEWRVRTAASDLLRTPVWSVKAGPSLNVGGLVAEALTALEKHHNFEPLPPDTEERTRLVAYSYPRLGIPCRRRNNPDGKFVIDLGDLSILALDSPDSQQNPESVTAVWSPYDIVVRSTIAQLRSLWKRNMALLPVLPQTIGDLPEAIKTARASILEEKTTNPELILDPQQTNEFCAAATAKMILEHHDISKTQSEIALAMNTGPSGALPVDQVEAIPSLTDDQLLATLDETTSLNEAKMEICQNRPFKTGGPIHARACGGFKVEAGGKNCLYIYDPWPPNQGDCYYENWDANRHANYMYVRARLFS